MGRGSTAARRDRVPPVPATGDTRSGQVAGVEAERTGLLTFEQQLDAASKRVAAWPAWKRAVLSWLKVTNVD